MNPAGWFFPGSHPPVRLMSFNCSTHSPCTVAFYCEWWQLTSPRHSSVFEKTARGFRSKTSHVADCRQPRWEQSQFCSYVVRHPAGHVKTHCAYHAPPHWFITPRFPRLTNTPLSWSDISRIPEFKDSSVIHMHHFISAIIVATHLFYLHPLIHLQLRGNPSTPGIFRMAYHWLFVKLGR